MKTSKLIESIANTLSESNRNQVSSMLVDLVKDAIKQYKKLNPNELGVKKIKLGFQHATGRYSNGTPFYTVEVMLKGTDEDMFDMFLKKNRKMLFSGADEKYIEMTPSDRKDAYDLLFQ